MVFIAVASYYQIIAATLLVLRFLEVVTWVWLTLMRRALVVSVLVVSFSFERRHVGR